MSASASVGVLPEAVLVLSAVVVLLSTVLVVVSVPVPVPVVLLSTVLVVVSVSVPVLVVSVSVPVLVVSAVSAVSALVVSVVGVGVGAGVGGVGGVGAGGVGGAAGHHCQREEHQRCQGAADYPVSPSLNGGTHRCAAGPRLLNGKSVLRSRIGKLPTTILVVPEPRTRALICGAVQVPAVRRSAAILSVLEA